MCSAHPHTPNGAFSFLAHDFATEGAHACEAEGFSAILVVRFNFSVFALFTFFAFLAFMAFLALFGLCLGMSALTITMCL